MIVSGAQSSDLVGFAYRPVQAIRKDFPSFADVDDKSIGLRIRIDPFPFVSTIVRAGSCGSRKEDLQSFLGRIRVEEGPESVICQRESEWVHSGGSDLGAPLPLETYLDEIHKTRLVHQEEAEDSQ